MKRMMVVLFAVILALTMLSACTGPAETTVPEETTGSVEPATEKTDPTTTAPTDPSTAAPTETTPSETAPPETEPYTPADPAKLHFAPEEYPVIDGSTATKPLAKAFQEALTGEKGVEINHSKTGKAYTKLVDGEVDLILVVEPSEDNKAYADEKDVTLKLSKVANEGFVFFVNKRNPINSLTADQIRKIYSGEITNWKEVGGLDAEIVAFQRPVNSGSQTGMESIVMGDVPLMEPVTEHIAGSMEDIIDVISAFDGGENAIGYSYYYYANTMYLGENIKMIGVDGVMPNNTTICDMEYPFLTAYYTVTREGDESGNTKDLLAYMLSEYGQRNVLEAGYVPIFDVGTAPSEGKEASDERTIHLSDTYDKAGIRVTEVREERNGSHFACLQIDGLRDEAMEKKVNELLWENSETAFEEALRKTESMSDKAMVQETTRLIDAFADLVSAELTIIITDGEGNVYNEYRPITVSLRDGEVIRFHDLFRTDAEGKDIFNSAAYSFILTSIGNQRYGEDGQIRIEDYNDVEDLMLDLITVFNAGEDIPFAVTPGALKIYTDFRGNWTYFDIYFENFMEEVTLFSKYPAGSDLYTGEYRAEKNIPILVTRPYTEYGFFEKGEDYYLNLAIHFEMGANDIDNGEEAYRFFDQRAEYLRETLKSLRYSSGYILYEGAISIRTVGSEMSYDGDKFQVYGSTQAIRMIVDSKEEFETLYEKLLSKWRDPIVGEPGLYTRGMYGIIWEATGSEFPYEYQNEFEDVYLLKGYDALRPYRSHRIKLSDLDGMTDEEILKKLQERNLSEVYDEELGNEAEIVGTIVKMIQKDPELLRTRNWEIEDPVLYEAAERVADCIKP